MELEKQEQNLPAPQSQMKIWHGMFMRTLQLMDSDQKETRAVAKMKFAGQVREMMVAGDAKAALCTRQFQAIRMDIAEHGETPVLFRIAQLIRDFCGTFNVPRNMDADQITGCAVVL